MIRSLILVAGVVVGVSACQSDSAGPAAGDSARAANTIPPSWSFGDMQAAHGQPRFVRRSTSPREDSLIQKVLSYYSGASREQLYTALYDQRSSVGRYSGPHPEVGKLLDEIAAIREARMDSIAESERQYQPVKLAAMLVAHLPTHDSTATAVIIRRVGLLPHDVVLFPEHSVTPGSFASAINSLLLARRRTSDDPTQNELLVVHGDSMPSRWKANGEGQIFANELYRLKAAGKQSIVGVGSGPTIQVFARRTHAVK